MLEKLLKIYPKGSDITIMNVMYQYSRKDEQGVRQPDFLMLVYKDNTTGKKNHIIIKKPTYRFYRLKKEYGKPNYNLLFIPESKVDPIEVPYCNFFKELANCLDNDAIATYNDVMSSGDRRVIREGEQKIQTDPRLFNSDQSIEDHYRLEFSKLYTNNIGKLHKAFFDIENDIKYINNEFPDPKEAEAPINAISFHDEAANVQFSFLLRNKENPLVGKLEYEYKTGSFTPEDIHDFVKNTLGYKKMTRMGLMDTEFRLFWFDTEIELLRTFFLTVYKYDPDFIEGWNSSGFDLNYIIHRIQKLGYDPATIMSDPNWEMPYLRHHIDEKNKNDLPERGDYTYLACNTIWMDQMIQFASRRKAKYGSFNSFKLDDIGELTAGIHKLDYSDITTNIGELPWLDYKTFVLYNIMDTIVQKGIEQKTNDLEYIFAKCIVNNTSYQKGHRQTVYLINRMTKEWSQLGFIIGNNANKNNPEPPKFQGALVGDPLKTSDKYKLKIDGQPIMVADNMIDFDQLKVA